MDEKVFHKYRRKNPMHPAAAGAVATGNCAIVVPVCGEPVHGVAATLESLHKHAGNALKIFVVNRPENAPAEIAEANLAVLKYVQSIDDPALLVLDTGIVAGGVGMARKIGMDSAVGLISDPENADSAILLSLDADTVVDSGYLPMAFRALANAAGASFNVRHQFSDDPKRETAIREYERYLEHYRSGLEKAGSPYAFKAIGSAIGCTVQGYIECGGMRVREAGEDFYFLQALAKCREVVYVPEIHIFPSPRSSQRVPFGTGRAVDLLMSGGKLNYFPEAAFVALGEVLHLATADNLQSAERFLAALPVRAQELFRRGDFAAKWMNLVRESPRDRLRSEFLKYFDGLKQLQFLKSATWETEP